jgi:hypothetical protein
MGKDLIYEMSKEVMNTLLSASCMCSGKLYVVESSP